MTNFSKTNLSIDIGGTKTLILIFDKDFHIIFKYEFSTNAHLKGDEKDFEKLIEYIAKKTPINSFKTVGLSIKGDIISGHIKFLSLLGGEVNVDLKKIFKKRFRSNRFIFDNDVCAMAKAENKFGVGRQTSDFTIINLGTGMRVVNVINNKLQRGSIGMAGEIGFVKIANIKIGRIEYFDTFVSGRGLGVLAEAINNKKMTAKDIFNKKVINLISIFVENIVTLLLQVTYYYNPSVIVFTGSLTQSNELWLPNVIKEYDRNIYPKIIRPKEILISKLKNPASIGAIIS